MVSTTHSRFPESLLVLENSTADLCVLIGPVFLILKVGQKSEDPAVRGIERIKRKTIERKQIRYQTVWHTC